MGARKTSSLQPFDTKRLLYLIIPALAYVVPGIILMGWSEQVYVIRFLLTMLIFSLAAFPLAVRLFPLSRSGGFTLAKPLGLLASALAVWTLSYLQIGRVNLIFIIISIAALAFACWYPKSLRENALDTLSKDGTVENIAAEETVFALALTILCFYKGFNPNINGQEKFMDYGFMMSMIRNSRLPANDMWLSGYSINYYYFGQYIYAFLARMSFIKPGVMYTVAMCNAIALPFAMCYSIGQMLIDGARAHGVHCNRFIAIIGGILTGFAVCIFGNSHSYFYDQNSIGNGLLELFYEWGIDVGRTDNFFYPDSTRFIGYNPDSSLIEGIKNGGDYTIEEFPFYSYLVGDLHAHVCSMIVVLLIFALAVTLVSKVLDRDLEPQFYSFLLKPEYIAIAILLGIAQMTNYWDFMIYFIFGSMLLLVVNTYRSEKFSTVFGAVLFFVVTGGILGIYLISAHNPIIHTLLQIILFAAAMAACWKFPCALTRTSAGMSFFFAAASVVSLPFNFCFDMISNSIAACVNHSSLYQLYILWGTHVIICVTFLVFIIVFRNTPSEKKSKKTSAEPSYASPVEKFFKERNPIDVLVSGSIVVGILLLIFPEIFYVRDIYTGGYLRSNTMFKFTYAGFIILSICMIYAVMRLMFIKTRDGNFSTTAFVISIIFCFMLLVPAHYTIESLKQRSGELVRENFKTLDGTAYLDDYTSPNMNNVRPGNLNDYQACIEWFNEEVDGDPVILEAYGLSYTDNNIVSAYTGLPSVCGWQTHEWLWRFHGIVDPETDLLISDPDYDVWELYLTPRHTDIDLIYTSNDPDTVYSLLKKYDVAYVVIGDMERSKYSGLDNTGIFLQFGNIAFISGDLMVIEIW